MLTKSHSVKQKTPLTNPIFLKAVNICKDKKKIINNAKKLGNTWSKGVVDDVIEENNDIQIVEFDITKLRSCKIASISSDFEDTES